MDYTLNLSLYTYFHFNDSILTSEYFGPNYTVFRRDRETGETGGGVLIAVNNIFVSSKEPIASPKEAEVLWVKVTLKTSRALYIGVCYRPHTNDAHANPAIDSALEKLCKRGQSTIILGGDFNLPDWD